MRGKPPIQKWTRKLIGWGFYTSLVLAGGACVAAIAMMVALAIGIDSLLPGGPPAMSAGQEEKGRIQVVRAEPLPASTAAVREPEAASLPEPPEEPEDREEQERAETIQRASLSRNADAVETLIDSARNDPVPDNRGEAVRALWYSAADGLDADGEIRDVLEEARYDRDPEVAALAEEALEDLEALEARREAE